MATVKNIKRKRYCVYVYRDPRPGKHKAPIYVGQGKRKRPYMHLFPSKWDQRAFHRILAKCRALDLSPIIEIIAYFDNEKDAKELERALIARYGRRDLGTGTLCNLTDGGDGTSGYVPTLAARQVASSILIRLHKNSAFCDKRADGWNKWWADETVQKEFADRRGALSRTPECRAQASALGKKRWDDPKFRSLARTLTNKNNSDPILIAAKVARLRKQNANPEFQQQVQKKRRVWLDKPSTRADMRKNYAKNAAIKVANRKYWDDPKNRAAQGGRMRQRSLDPAHQALCMAGRRDLVDPILKQRAVALFADGMTNRQVAATLGISKTTAGVVRTRAVNDGSLVVIDDYGRVAGVE